MSSVYSLPWASHWAPAQPLDVRVQTTITSLFFYQPASLLTSYISSSYPLLLTSKSLRLTTGSWTHQWERAQCADWTEGELYQWAIRRTHRCTQISQSCWPPHTEQLQAAGHTSVTSQLAIGAKCVCPVCEPMNQRGCGKVMVQFLWLKVKFLMCLASV